MQFFAKLIERYYFVKLLLCFYILWALLFLTYINNSNNFIVTLSDVYEYLFVCKNNWHGIWIFQEIFYKILT